MNTHQGNTFLAKMKGEIKRGEYDKYLTIPFMSKELLYAAIKAKCHHKEELGHNPLLTESEIKLCINDAKETAIEIANLFINIGILEKTIEEYDVSEIGKALIK
jgi:hypothetical protein